MEGERPGEVVVAEALRELARAELGARYWVWGYSMGARLALRMARRFPEEIAGVVLIGATPGIADSIEREARREEDQRLGEWIEAHGVEAFRERWSAVPLISTQKRMPAKFREAMMERKLENTSSGLRWALATLGQGVMGSQWEGLGEVTLPVLLVVGEEDEKYRRIAERMKTAMLGATVEVVEGAGHAPHLEQPGAFCEGVSRWMGEELASS